MPSVCLLAVQLVVLAQSVHGLAPVHSFAPASQLVEGSFIVKFLPDAGGSFEDAQNVLLSLGVNIKYVYDFEGFKGIAARLDETSLAAAQSLSGVAYVEPDGYMEISEDGRQSPATWGLDRVDQEKPPLDNAFFYDVEAQGEDVLAYILDTGIYTSHEDFGGRAVFGSCHPSTDPQCETDCQSHGTHVAGTVGSTTFGVAKKATLVAVKVCQGCSGSCILSEVIQGVQWSVGHHAKNAKKKLSTLNMSLQYPRSDALNEALAAAADGGVLPVVAGANFNADACRYSPASAPRALSCGATTDIDARSSFSNYGPCVDIYAPGSNIESLRNADSGSSRMSGTSMASPHVCGLAAVLISNDQFSTTDEVKDEVIRTSTDDVISGLPSGSLNRFLFTNPPNRP